jgi:hypothetical protein
MFRCRSFFCFIFLLSTTVSRLGCRLSIGTKLICVGFCPRTTIEGSGIAWPRFAQTTKENDTVATTRLTWKENHTDNCHREKKYVQNGGVRTVRGG